MLPRFQSRNRLLSNPRQPSQFLLRDSQSTTLLDDLASDRHAGELDGRPVAFAVGCRPGGKFGFLGSSRKFLQPLQFRWINQRMRFPLRRTTSLIID